MQTHDVHSGSADRFGYSWQNFDSLSEEQGEQFRRWTVHIDPTEGWRGKRFLDVGCGRGRNSFWAMTYGAVAGTAIDIDERSLESARRNLNDYPTVEVRYESIYEISEGSVYDIAFSIGVIHHLEDPDLAVARMRAAVKPGGQVLIWVYGYENMELYVRLLDPARKLLFSRLPIGFVRLLAHIPAAALWLLLRSRILRLEYFRLLEGLPYRHIHHIVFDQMLPRIANYWRRDEVETLMRRAGLEDVRCSWVNEMSWSAIGTKPAEVSD